MRDTILIKGDPFERYDIIRSFHYTGVHTGIVTDKIKENGSTKLIILPYKVPKNKWLRILKLWWLKIRVHYS
jgi:hypothetical protein